MSRVDHDYARGASLRRFADEQFRHGLTVEDTVFVALKMARGKGSPRFREPNGFGASRHGRESG